MNSSNPPPDANERRAAVAIGRSVIVQAPAGSGKTTLLVERFLNLLAVVERPEEILAITFTRKAAAEMLERVLGCLDDDSDRSRSIRTRSRALGWHIETQPARLHIQTIDAFCVGLVQRLPISSGLGGRLRIVEDAHAFYQEAIDRTFERLAYDDPLNPELLGFLALFDNDFDKARASLSTMLAKRDQWLGAVALTLRSGHASDAPNDDETRRRAITHVIEAAIRALHAAAFGDITADLNENVRRELADVAADAARRMNVEWNAIGLPTNLTQWRFIADLVTTRNGQPRVRLGSAQGFNDARTGDQSAKARLKALIDELTAHDLITRLSSLRLLPVATLDVEAVDAIVNVTTGLALAAAELDDAFRRNRVIDFAELTFAAQRALGEPESPTDLALALDYRIKHVLIDEFQDTSAIQYRLVERLLQEWSNDGARSLFVVGDPMQSIYRFRDADVALFQRTRRNGIAELRPAAIRVSANFRSSTALVQWCNAIFAGSFGDVDDPALGRVAFSMSAPVLDAQPGDGCRVYAIRSDDADRTEAATLVQVIESIRRDHAGESIAVLVRNRAHLAYVLPRLTAQKVPWAGSDIHALADQPVIGDLLSLLKALASESDRIAWLALLRAPFVGMSLRDLESLAQFDESIAASVRTGAHDDALSEDGRQRIHRIRPVLLQAERSRAQLPVRQWIENVFIRLGGADAYDDVGAIPHAQRLLDLIEDDHGRALDIAALERSVQRLFAEPSAREGHVVVMTIHRAKGLEFDHVLVPGLHRVNRIDDPATILWRPEAGQLLLGVRGSIVGDGVHRWLSHEERHRDANERIRMLYVAATRARRSLHLFGALDEVGGELQPPPARSLFAPVWRFARDRIQVIRDIEPLVGPTTATHERHVLPAEYVWRPPSPGSIEYDTHPTTQQRRS
jgi:ATP-dependent exoDNAse (exonuclease V) beta subunit